MEDAFNLERAQTAQTCVFFEFFLIIKKEIYWFLILKHAEKCLTGFKSPGTAFNYENTNWSCHSRTKINLCLSCSRKFRCHEMIFLFLVLSCCFTRSTRVEKKKKLPSANCLHFKMSTYDSSSSCSESSSLNEAKASRLQGLITVAARNHGNMRETLRNHHCMEIAVKNGKLEILALKNSQWRVQLKYD